MKLRQVRAWALIGCLFCAASLRSQQSGIVPRLIKFGGEINPQTTQIKGSESATNPSPTVVGVTFSLYQLQEGGNSLWSESQKVAVDEQGRYTVLLGATQPEGLPLDLFTSGKALWLGIQPQMPGAVEQPRVLLVAVPYALKAADADTLGGQPASAYALAGSPTVVMPAAGASPDSSSHSARPDFTTPGGGGTPSPDVACGSTNSDGSAVANQVVLYSGACALTENASFVDVAGKVGIGIANPLWPLEVIGTSTSISGNNYAFFARATWTPSANDAADAAMGLVLQAQKTGTFNSTAAEGLRGVQANAINAGTGTVTGEAALSGGVQNTSTGVVTNGYGAYILAPIASVADPITNAYGFYATAQTATGVTNGYGFYSAGATDTNVLMGPVGIATATPTSGFKLEVNGTTKFDGLVTFAGGQTFGSAVTSVTAGTGILVTGTSSAPIVSADESVLATSASVTTAVNAGVTTAETFATTAVGTGVTTAETFATTAVGTGVTTAETFATTAVGTGVTTAEAFATAADTTVLTTAEGFATTAANTAATTAEAASLPLAGGTLTGGLLGTTASFSSTGSFTGALTASGGATLPATAAATSSAGANSNPLDLFASSYNSATPAAVDQDFRWLAEPTGNNTASPSAILSLQFGAADATPADTGLSIASNGQITFAAGQAFPGTGAGTVTSVTGGTGITVATGTTTPVVSADHSVVAFLTDLAPYALSADVATAISAGEVAAEGVAEAASLPIGGGTLTGALTGTTASFTGLALSGALTSTSSASFTDGTLTGVLTGTTAGLTSGAAAAVDTLVINNTSSSTNNIITAQYNGSNVFRVDQAGDFYYDGTSNAGGADFAESVAVGGERSDYGPGDLLVIERGARRSLTLSQTPYSTMVAGIYSTKPGVLASLHSMDAKKFKQEVPLAVVGIVPCKVTAENGAIQEGDLLVTSSRPGYAMKGTDRSQMLGAVVGKAMEPLPNGTGVIQVLVTLQ
ncbi:MAG: hypothetical protein ACLQOO_27555 [Terriglobia bacterium]